MKKIARFTGVLLVSWCVPMSSIGAPPLAWNNERPSWMPDGQSLVFGTNRDGNGELYVMNADGSNQRNITNTPNREMFPAVSPDGSKIAYVGEVDGNYDIYVMSADGSGKTRLTEHPGLDDWPSWTEGGNRIVFDSDRSGRWGIYWMNADGSSLEVLVDTEEKEADPVASPCERKVVFSRGDDTRQLVVLDLNTGDESGLTDNEQTNAHPSIDCTHDLVAFNSGEAYWGIYSISIDGAGLQRLTNHQHDDKWPAWSPDGSQIAFMSNRDGQWDIFVMDNEGNGLQRLTNGSQGRP